MQSHGAQIRCLDHSNVLTIYCITERKALCANCVYGYNRHRTHKLVPLKDAIQEINEDSSLLWNQINSDLKKMDESVKITQDNTIVLEREMKKRLKKVEEEYYKHSDEIKAKYDSDRQKIEQTYQNLIDKSRRIEVIV